MTAARDKDYKWLSKDLSNVRPIRRHGKRREKEVELGPKFIACTRRRYSRFLLSVSSHVTGATFRSLATLFLTE